MKKQRAFRIIDLATVLAANLGLLAYVMLAKKTAIDLAFIYSLELCATGVLAFLLMLRAQPKTPSAIGKALATVAATLGYAGVMLWLLPVFEKIAHIAFNNETRSYSVAPGDAISILHPALSLTWPVLLCLGLLLLGPVRCFARRYLRRKADQETYPDDVMGNALQRLAVVVAAVAAAFITATGVTPLAPLLLLSAFRLCFDLWEISSRFAPRNLYGGIEFDFNYHDL